MQKRVFIVHGWGGYPEEGWLPWLKEQLEHKGFQVHVPQLPDTNKPRIEKWVPALAHAVGAADPYTFFVGHSMGCQTIARYLATLPEGAQVGGAVFVGGFFRQLNIGESEDPEIRKHWLDTPLDLAVVRSHLPKSFAIFSDDDPWVPLDNQDEYKNILGSHIIIEHGMKHFTDSDGIKELPSALQAVLECA